MSLAGSSDELRDFRLNNNLISRLCLPPSLSLSLFLFERAFSGCLSQRRSRVRAANATSECEIMRRWKQTLHDTSSLIRNRRQLFPCPRRLIRAYIRGVVVAPLS
jgi:hypothetical protein